MTLDAVKAGVLLFIAAVLQASIMPSISILGAAPNLLLVTLLSIALLRGDRDREDSQADRER